MRDRKLFIYSLLLSITMLSGCSGKNADDKSVTKTYPVKTLEVKDKSYPITLEYEGITGGSEVRKLSFKSSAKIYKIYVTKGQPVKKGDKLVELDKSDLNIAMDAAKSQMDAASAQYNKAVNGAQQEDISKAEIAVKNSEDSYNYYKDLYNKTVKLFESDAVPKQQVDSAKLQMDSYESALNNAKQTLQQVQNGSRSEDKEALLAQLNAARANYNSKASLVQDATMTADVDGYVVDTPCKEGELQAAGYPVVLLRSEKQVIKVGLSDEDVKRVQVGTKTQVKIDDITTEGEIINIVQMADSQSGTYSAEIKLLNPIDNNKFYIGKRIKVFISIGEKNGIWIPISSILNDGEDYVFVVENGHAVRKSITLENTNEGNVSVEGLKSGDKLVVEGMKNIKAGYQVKEK